MCCWWLADFFSPLCKVQSKLLFQDQGWPGVAEIDLAELAGYGWPVMCFDQNIGTLPLPTERGWVSMVAIVALALTKINICL